MSAFLIFWIFCSALANDESPLILCLRLFSLYIYDAIDTLTSRLPFTVYLKMPKCIRRMTNATRPQFLRVCYFGRHRVVVLPFSVFTYFVFILSSIFFPSFGYLFFMFLSVFFLLRCYLFFVSMFPFFVLLRYYFLVSLSILLALFCYSFFMCLVKFLLLNAARITGLMMFSLLIKCNLLKSKRRLAFNTPSHAFSFSCHNLYRELIFKASCPPHRK